MSQENMRKEFLSAMHVGMWAGIKHFQCPAQLWTLGEGDLLFRSC